MRNFAVFAVQFWVDKNITFVVQFASSTVCSQNCRVFPFFFRHSLKRSDKWPTTSEVAPFFFMMSLKFLHDELERLQTK